MNKTARLLSRLLFKEFTNKRKYRFYRQYGWYVGRLKTNKYTTVKFES